MSSNTSPNLDAVQPDSSLASVLAALTSHEDKELQIIYGQRRTQRGYHVTEVKAGSFVALDCGSNADAWQETVLQVEDIPLQGGSHAMTVGKFRNILAQVDKKVRLNGDARVTVEIGLPGEPMQVFDVAGVGVDGDVVTMQLGPRPAICKPRHRAAAQAAAASSCCSSSASSSCC